MLTVLLDVIRRCYSRDVYSLTAQFYLSFRLLSVVVLRWWLGSGWNIFRRPLRKFGFLFIFDLPLFDGSICSKAFFDHGETVFWITNVLNMVLAIYVFLPVIVGIVKALLRAVS